MNETRKHHILSEIVQRLKHENFYWNVGFYALVFAASTHFFFIFLFLVLDVPFLALVNVASVGIYLYCIFGLGFKTLDEKDDRLIGWLVYFELLGHGIVATLSLGLESGFQYYIYALVLIPFFVSSYTLKIRILRVLSVILVILLLEIWGRHSTPFVTLKQEYLDFLHYMNLIFFLLIIALISYLYTISGNLYQKMLFEQSNHDHLTNLYNRRYVSELFQYDGPIRRKEDPKRYALLLIDVDNFKQINDRYGHRGGDAVLVRLAEVLKQNVRQSTIVCRWGGEEFLIVLEEGSFEELSEVAERLRTIIEQTPIIDENEFDLTVTLGGAVSSGEDTFDEVFARADKALYHGKQNGKNRVVII